MWKLITGHRLRPLDIHRERRRPILSFVIISLPHRLLGRFTWCVDDPFVLHNNTATGRRMRRCRTVYIHSHTPVIDWPSEKINISKGIVILCHKFLSVERGGRAGAGNVSTIYSHTTRRSTLSLWVHETASRRKERRCM